MAYTPEDPARAGPPPPPPEPPEPEPEPPDPDPEAEEPGSGEPGSGFQFSSTVVGGNVPKEFFPAIEKGFESMMAEGTVAGFPQAEPITDEDLITMPVDALVLAALGNQIRADNAHRVRADIILEERTLLDWLLDPIVSLRGRQ